MKISVVIPSKNGLHHLKDCLPSVIEAAKNYHKDIHLVVVDDNSSDGTPEEAPRLFPEVTFLKNPDQGACSARNHGVEKFPCDWICFLDNDVFVDKDFFNTLEKYLRPDVFCVTCAGYAAYPKVPGAWEQLDGVKLLEQKGGFLRFTKNVYNKDLPSMDEYPSWGVQGAYFACRRARFDELGGFDALLEPYLLEETDVAYRGLKRGWKIFYAPDTKLKHKCGGTINSKKSKRTQFLSKRNRILFVWKNVQSSSVRFLCWARMWLSFSPRLWRACLRLAGQARAKARKEALAARVSDRELLTQSAAFSAKATGKNSTRRKLNVARQIDYLQRRLLRYESKYDNVWKIALHMLSAVLASLQFSRNEQSRLEGPLRVCVKLGGGLGDMVIRINWVYAFFNKFLRDTPSSLTLSSSNKKLLASVAPDFAESLLTSKQSERKRYDLVISLDVRVPVVEYADVLRLPSGLAGYVERLVCFERENREILQMLPYKDSLTRNILSQSLKWWRHPDVLEEFALREEFLIDVKLIHEKAVLKKFALSPGRYITVNREVGDCDLKESTKLWPLAYYRELLEKIKKRYPSYQTVEIGTEKGERINNAHRSLKGKTSLEEMKVVLKNAALHIDGEGGLVHLRHALKGGPSCVLFGPSSPEVLGYSENLNLRGTGCSVCCEFYSKTWQQGCMKGKRVCMESLSPEYVLDKILSANILR